LLNFKQFENFNLDLVENEKIELIIKKILDEKKPDIIGISILFYSQLGWAREIAKLIKRLDKKIFIIAGGGYLLSIRGFLLKNRKKIEYFDGIIFGDGEEPLEKLIINLSGKKELDNIPNLFLPKSDTTNYAPYLALKSNFDTEPCFDNLLDISKMDRFIPLRISRGCYWGQCVFCHNCKEPKIKYRILNPRKISRLVKLIKKLQKKYNQNFFCFNDDAIPPFYLEKIAEELLRQKADIIWSVSGLCFDKKFTDKKLVALLEKSGFFIGRFGAESFSPRILKLMGKMHTPELAREILETFHSLSISVSINIMFNFPSETERDVMQTLNFLKEYRHLYKYAYINIFYPQPDTYIYNHFKEFRLKKESPQKIISINNKISNRISRLLKKKKIESIGKVYVAKY